MIVATPCRLCLLVAPTAETPTTPERVPVAAPSSPRQRDRGSHCQIGAKQSPQLRMCCVGDCVQTASCSSKSSCHSPDRRLEQPTLSRFGAGSAQQLSPPGYPCCRNSPFPTVSYKRFYSFSSFSSPPTAGNGANCLTVPEERNMYSHGAKGGCTVWTEEPPQYKTSCRPSRDSDLPFYF